MSLNLIPQTQRLDLLLGQALDLTIPVTDTDGNAVDVEGATVDFTLGASSETTPTDTLPTTTAGNEITVNLTTAKSLELGVVSLFGACWVTILGESTPVARIQLNIKQSTRG